MPAVKIALGDPLTERELRVLELTAQGHASQRIGTMLGLTENTVLTYRKRIRVKLGAACSAHAVAIGFVKGYLDAAKVVTSR